MHSISQTYFTQNPFCFEYLVGWYSEKQTSAFVPPTPTEPELPSLSSHLLASVANSMNCAKSYEQGLAASTSHTVCRTQCKMKQGLLLENLTSKTAIVGHESKHSALLGVGPWASSPRELPLPAAILCSSLISRKHLCCVPLASDLI